MNKYINVRTIVFVLGAVAGLATIINKALANNLSIPEMIAVVCTAAATYALKWPGDLTSNQVENQFKTMPWNVEPSDQNNEDGDTLP